MADMRLAIVTKAHLTVIEGRKLVAKFEVGHQLSAAEVEAARTDDYRPMVRTSIVPGFGWAGLQPPYVQ